jgi:alginate lyase
MFKPQHFGLYFTQEHVTLAHQQMDQQPFQAAWHMLEDREQTGIAAAQWYGLRYRFNQNQAEGEQAIKALSDSISAPLNDDAIYLDAVTDTLTLAHAFEMVRDHLAFFPTAQDEWLRAYAARISLLDQLPYQTTYTEQLWQGALNLISGIVLEDETRFQTGVGVYQAAIRESIHPEGYVREAVEGKDGGSLLRHVLSIAALSLMAEASWHVGLDLWNYTYRGVSVITAGAYAVYYYYYPDKWRWDTGVSTDPFLHYGGFLEMLHRHSRLKAMKEMLDDLRPVYDPRTGGLTTLTHGVVSVSKRGLFG